MDLPTTWFLIICLEVGLYIILDGADLGIGLLSLFPQEEKSRALLMHAVGPIWDANETWLVIAGGTIFGAFPMAYGIILNALYIPAMIILFGLILRAVSFEFRAMSTQKRAWTILFGLGSLMAIIGQGFAAGGLLNGIAIRDGQFSGGQFDWFSPLTLFITAGIMMSYVVVGYAYLIKKMDFEYQTESFFRIFIAATITFAAFAGATILLPQKHLIFLQRWTTEPTLSILVWISGLILFCSVILCYAVIKKTLHRHIHTICLLIFGLSFAGVIVAIYPYLAPPTLTIFQAAASPATLTFMLYGIGPLLPIVLGYNYYMYYVFRGDTSADRSEDY